MVEVLTTAQRRRWTVAEKVQLVQESLQPGMHVLYVARRNGLSPSQLFRWRRLMSDRGKTAIQADDQVVGAGEVRALKKRIRDLERMQGKKTMEVEILQEALEIAREKKLISRSRLAERVKDPARERPPRYSKAEDEVLLPLIRDIIDHRLTYGYRRVCAVLNRRLVQDGHARVNHKRVYRIMRLHGLLLAKHKGYRPDRSHDGKVITLKSNLRWCSDGFEIHCDSGEVVRVVFALDCCDREAMGAIATTAGISGQMVQDLMLECVEKRFGVVKAPQPVEWLSDNGSCYTARETVAFATLLGLLPRFTPVRSPESNGMAEAFVNTFKRDYVHVHARPDAATVLAQLPGWFEDYNERHPHKGLRMKSPREFIRASATAGCPV